MERAKVEKKQLEVGGELFHFFEIGEGPTIVLFPGFGEGAKNLLRLAGFLKESFHVIFMETPGFVEGQRMPAQEYRFDLQVDRLHGCFQKLGLTSFAIGGNSSGGNLAVAYGLRYPDEISHLILLAPQGIESSNFFPYAQKLNLVETIPQFDQMMAKLYHQPPVLPSGIKGFLIEKMQKKFDWLNQLREVIRSGPYAVLNEDLPLCKIPSLLIWGASDGIIPITQGRIFSELLPDCQYYEIEKVGHLPQLEAAEETSALILNFMKVVPQE